jgi:hypothetical protein
MCFNAEEKISPLPGIEPRLLGLKALVAMLTLEKLNQK